MSGADSPARWPELVIVSPVIALALAAAFFVATGQWFRALAAGIGVVVAFFLVGVALDRYYRARPGAVHPMSSYAREDDGADGSTDERSRAE